VIGLGLLIQVLVLCLILGTVYVFRKVPLLAPFSWLAEVICVVIVVIFLINLLLGFSGPGALGWRLR
jgi:uncharacterized membrane protein YjdF